MDDKQKRILIVEDDLSTRELLRRSLVNADYDVTAVGDAPDALRTIRRSGLPHLVLLDLGLPTMHGFELSKKIKELGDVPIIFLTGEDDEEMIVTGIEEYAEDYLVKPVGPRELTARIRRVLSRIHDLGYASGPLTVVDEHVSVDLTSSRVIVDQTPIELTPIEARILWTLLNNAGRIVRTEQLLERVWPGENMPEETLRVNISRLRRKLSYPNQDHEYLQNERGIGYKFSFPL